MADDLDVVEKELPAIRKKSLSLLSPAGRRKFDECLAYVWQRFDQGADSVTIGRELIENGKYHQDCISANQCVIDYWRSRRAAANEFMQDAQYIGAVSTDIQDMKYCGTQCKTITNRIGKRLCAHSGLTCRDLNCRVLLGTDAK